MGPDELEAALTETDWDEAFDDRPDRSHRDFRRKQDDIDLVLPYKLRLHRGSMRLPMGLKQAQTLTNLLKTYELWTDATTDFDALPIPYRAVAADLETGEAVVLDRGSLGTAMRASMSIPGVFPPVELDGRLLVDGGIVANLPVEIAQSFEPDVVIAVDISTPLEGRKTPDSYLKVIRRLGGLLTKRNVGRDKDRLGPDDILIEPELGTITVADFERTADAIAIGDAATRAALDRLSVLSVTPAAWETWLAGHRREPSAGPTIGSIRVRNASPLSDDVVLARIRQRVGETLDADVLLEDLSRLYGTEVFDPITFDLEPGADGVDLVLDVRERRAGLTSLQFGLSLEEDFRGGSGYVFDTRVQRLAVNEAGGEWRADVRFGKRSGIRTDFYQPLDARLRWYVNPFVFFDQSQQYVIDDGRRLAEVLLDEYGAGFEVGRNLANWGRVGASLSRGVSAGEVLVPDDLIPRDSREVTAWGVALQADTLDMPVWPTSGWFGELRYARTESILGGETESADLITRVEWAMTTGRLTFVPGFQGTFALDGERQLFRAVTLGGEFKLSGLEPEELIGEESILARLVTYYSLTGPTLGVLKPEWYLGLSLEAGDVFDDGDPIVANRLRASGSVFLGSTSVLGPLRIGYGYAEGGRHRVYLALGRGLP
jgi:NTE family protein